jgi:ABC-type transport system involved in multi-copper enzyme maturation permease subunit
MKALALKELRELRGIAAIALGVYLVLVGRMIGLHAFDWAPALPQDPEFPPFAAGEFVQVFALIACVFAMALGFRQSAWEAAQGTFLFLLHRPVSRRRIFLTKLATGIGVYLVCSSLPILLYGWWAATPGNQASPFRWAWTNPSWLLMGVMLLAYVGAFLSGIRPGRWYGTRLMPLFAMLVLAEILFSIRSQQLVRVSDSVTTAIAAGAGCLVVGIIYVVLICNVAQTRDYA